MSIRMLMGRRYQNPGDPDMVIVVNYVRKEGWYSQQTLGTDRPMAAGEKGVFGLVGKWGLQHHPLVRRRSYVHPVVYWYISITADLDKAGTGKTVLTW